MHILLVDDDREGRSFLTTYLSLQGHAVVECDSGEEALAAYQSSRFEMVLSDIRMSGMSGIDLITAIKALNRDPKADLVLYTGFVDVALAVAALRAGAYDYLTKPINMSELRAVLERVEEHQALLYENRQLTEHFEETVREATKDAERQLTALRELVAEQARIKTIGAFSDVMKRIVDQALQYHADRSIPVLIQGETGVGKEVIANIIHYGDLENPGPLVDINCTAITPSLFESELFGYEAGSFTGSATRGQKGKLDMAAGGTLFLDEIAEIPVELQAKLLRVLEEKSFYRVGGLKKVKTDVRIIAATNLDFERRFEEGLFRKDLYYRLKVGHIVIPPLRERRDDILPLCLMFLRDFSRVRGKRFSLISDRAADFLLSYPWPGNVRELRNAMEWVSCMHDDVELRPEHLGNLMSAEGAPKPPAPKQPDAEHQSWGLPSGAFNLEKHTDELITEALQMHGGNKTQTAKYLGISLRTLYYRLERIQHQH